VIQTGAGVCHTYVDRDADIKMAADIIFNAKTSRPSVCNACDCMLVHKDIARKALPAIADRLREKNVEIRGDERVMDIISGCTPANEDDWGKEYLDYIISAHIVDDIDAAIAHIADFGTGHSECIVTENEEAAKYFMEHVDAAAVYHNASTRFTDGGEFGLGAEIGISTQKLHARGPMGLAELTSYKYMVFGNGQVR
jgi:glutamate-5-semialdehyde dehydrogenase